jgi:hypothetical protein
MFEEEGKLKEDEDRGSNDMPQRGTTWTMFQQG